MMQRVIAAGSSGRTSPVRRTAARMRSGMLSGAMKYGIVRIDLRSARGQRGSGGEQRRQFRGEPFRGPGPLAFAEQPEPAHVAQVADGAVHAAFVGEVRLPAGFGQDRVLQFQPHQGPGAGGDVGEVLLLAPGRRRRRRRCRASRRPPPWCRPAGQSGRRSPGSSVPTVSPGCDQRREQLFGQAQGGQELGGPLPRDGVEQAGGGGVGRFRPAAARSAGTRSGPG